ncbi:MAG: ParB N-terminal domain-containing protein, partial [Proteobacteria bacterium]|nr:ParB N-terminal domain-containing protein [Pseudomonadota bacterium]
MPITDNNNYSFSFSMIDIKKIDPSPYQRHKYFDEDSLRELGVNSAGWIDRTHYPSPAKKGRFPLIAGERRLRAIK